MIIVIKIMLYSSYQMEKCMTDKIKPVREVKSRKKAKQASSDANIKPDARSKIEEILAQREFDKMYEL